MADFADNMKTVLNKSVKYIGRMFNTAASETKYKANEISIKNKRRELVTELGLKILEIAGNGFELPQDAAEIVSKINKLDNDMNILQNDHAAKKAAAAEQQAMEKAARATEKAAAKTAAAIEKSTAAVDVDASVTNEAVEPLTAPVLNVEETETKASESKAEVPTLEL